MMVLKALILASTLLAYSNAHCIRTLCGCDSGCTSCLPSCNTQIVLPAPESLSLSLPDFTPCGPGYGPSPACASCGSPCGGSCGLAPPLLGGRLVEVTKKYLVPSSGCGCSLPKPCGCHLPKPCGCSLPKPCGCHLPKPCGCHLPKPCGCHLPKPCGCHLPKPCGCHLLPKPCECQLPKPCGCQFPKPCECLLSKSCGCSLPCDC